MEPEEDQVAKAASGEPREQDIFEKPAARRLEPVLASDVEPVRRLALYTGLVVLGLQLCFVGFFFASYRKAALDLYGEDMSAVAGPAGKPSSGTTERTVPDLLQWSGAQSLVWIASLFAPDTPVRFAPALIFFLVFGGFMASFYQPAKAGNMFVTVMASAREGMRLWLSWFAGAAFILVYLVTSSGGVEALRTSAGITFDKPWTNIVEVFLAHWLIYIAWFALLGFLPMVGGVILGLLRTRFLTKTVASDRHLLHQLDDHPSAAVDSADHVRRENVR